MTNVHEQAESRTLYFFGSGKDYAQTPKADFARTGRAYKINGVSVRDKA